MHHFLKQNIFSNCNSHQKNCWNICFASQNSQFRNYLHLNQEMKIFLWLFFFTIIHLYLYRIIKYENYWWIGIKHITTSYFTSSWMCCDFLFQFLSQRFQHFKIDVNLVELFWFTFIFLFVKKSGMNQRYN